MTSRRARISVPPKTVIGYRKNGSPIYPIAGGSEPAVEQPVPPAPTAEPVVTIEVPPEPPAPTQRTFTADDIAKARQEEKDKLYGRLNNLETKFNEAAEQIKQQTQEREAAVAAAAEEARVAAEAEAQKRWEEQDSKSLLAEAQAEWDARFQKMQQERDTERALFEREREFTALRDYARTKVDAALADNEIAPELVDFVTGNTEAEIDASLDLVKAKTEQIVQSVADAQVQARASLRGVAPTGYAPTGPMDTDPAHKTFTAEQLKNMPMSEFAKYRGQLLGAASSRQQERGLFG